MFSIFPLKPFEKLPFYDFMKHRVFWIGSSAVSMIVVFALWFGIGLNFGIDFVGGKLVQVQMPVDTTVADVREAVDAAGFEGVTIQQYGTAREYLIRLPGNDPKSQPATAEQGIVGQLNEKIGQGVDVRRVEFVGPQVGQELRVKGLLAVVVAMLAIAVYVGLRFEFRYAVGALSSLLHDVMLTVGAMILLQTEITLTVLAAILTLVGYSLNDTIVIYDRIRENRGRYPNRPLVEILNLSVNQTMSRTIMTVMTTALVLVALYLFGGEVIHDFSLVLLLGIFLGTYSSIFVAAPMLLYLEGWYKDKDAKDAKKGKADA